MQELPKVNVLICNHNYGQYLNGAIQSVLRQTYPCHITIINNGCTDNSIDVLKNYVPDTRNTQTITPRILSDVRGRIIPLDKYEISRHPQFTLIFTDEAVGPSLARNIGIIETHDYTDAYAILDADDEMLPTKVQKLVELLYQAPNIGVAYADYDCVNIYTGNRIREYKEPYDMLRLNQECIVHSGSLIKKETLLDVLTEDGFYDNQLRVCEDYDLWLRISRKFIFAHLPESLTLVRVHNNNSTNSVHTDVWKQCMQRVRQKNQ